MGTQQYSGINAVVTTEYSGVRESTVDITAVVIASLDSLLFISLVLIT